MNVTNSRSMPVETPPKGVIWRWQLIIVTATLILPLFFSVYEYWSLKPRCGNCEGLLGRSAFLFGLVLFYFLPFFILAACVKRIFVKHWPNAKAAHAAIIGGLLGLWIGYVFVGSVIFRFRGAAEAIFWLFLVFWFTGLMLARVGLEIGPKFVRHASPTNS
jgi:hypothetical protein